MFWGVTERDKWYEMGYDIMSFHNAKKTDFLKK